jgi:hypothetical protein
MGCCCERVQIERKTSEAPIEAPPARRPELREGEAITTADIEAFERCPVAETDEQAEEWRINFDKYRLIKLAKMCGWNPTDLDPEKAQFLLDNVKFLVCKYRIMRWVEAPEKPSPEQLLAKLKDFFSKRYNKTFARKIDINTACEMIAAAQ